MVRIANIEINNTIASCSFYPENQEDGGKLSVDLSTGEIIKVDYPQDKCADMYIAHARNKLIEVLSSTNEIPAEAFSIWFWEKN